MAILDSTGAVVVAYTYDAWGLLLNTSGTMKDTLGTINPLTYRSYVYDHDTGLYYLQSRYYDPEMGRFVNGDDIVYLGIDGTLLSYNLFTYCKNNSVMGYDRTGHFGLIGGIIATCAIVGGILGAFSAAATGGNVLEGAIEGCLTGALGATCSLLWPSPCLAVTVAGLGGCLIDFATQISTQYIENGSVDVLSVDYGRVAKIGVQTAVGTAIPALGAGADDTVDAVGTALIWAEASTLIVCVDVIVTNVITGAQLSYSSISKNSSKSATCE